MDLPCAIRNRCSVADADVEERDVVVVVVVVVGGGGGGC